MAGITDTHLANAKDLILGDFQKLQDFEACQQYLKTLVYNKSTQEKHERQIAGVQQGGNPNKGRNGKNKRNKTNDNKDKNVTAWSYTPEEWSRLTPEQRQKIKELRAAKRTKSTTNTPRNTSSVQVDDGNPTNGVDAQDANVAGSDRNDNNHPAPTTQNEVASTCRNPHNTTSRQG